MEKTEIERKFLSPQIPPTLESIKRQLIQQGYLAIDPQTGREARVRSAIRIVASTQSASATYTQTVKSGAGIERPEVNIPLYHEQFGALWEATEGWRLLKQRSTYVLGTLQVEHDVFAEQLSGLELAEIEFPTRAAAEAFQPPAWLGREVTDDPRYKGQALVRMDEHERQQVLIEARSARSIDLESGIAEALRRIRTWLETAAPGATLVVLVAGGTASGKTSMMAEQLRTALGELASVLSMDDYYVTAAEKDALSELRGSHVSWDDPASVRLSLLSQHVTALRRGETIQVPFHSYIAGATGEPTPFTPRRVVIVEGIFALAPDVAPLGDLRIYVDIGPHGRLIRRLMRDRSRTGQTYGQITAQMLTEVEPLHQRFVAPSVLVADLVVTNEMDPRREASRSGASRRQVKFAAPALSAGSLERLNCEALSSTQQTDHYFLIRGSIGGREQSLRVREEEGTYRLTYKGPLASGVDWSDRPVMDFEVDATIPELLIQIYGASVVTVQKVRCLYRLNDGGILFSHDTVRYRDRRGDGQLHELGSYVELRGGADIDAEATALARALGLEQRITDPYLDLALASSALDRPVATTAP